MKFQFIDAAKEDFPVTRLGQILSVSPSDYFAGRSPSCSHAPTYHGTSDAVLGR